jgi:hypothetical protein
MAVKSSYAFQSPDSLKSTRARAPQLTLVIPVTFGPPESVKLVLELLAPSM